METKTPPGTIAGKEIRPKARVGVDDRLWVLFDLVLIFGVAAAFVSFFLLNIPRTAVAFPFIAAAGLLPVLASALRALVKFELTIDLLASIALIFSFISHEWVSAAFITLMLAFARLFDHWTEGKAKSVIASLMKYRPDTAQVYREKDIVTTPVEHLRAGDIVLIESGGRVPIDGTVMDGEAELNEASLTGESERVKKQKGDQVYTSTLCEMGSLTVRADRVGADTRLSKIITLVDEASRKKSHVEGIAATFTQYYILTVFSVSVAMYAVGVSPSFILSVLLVVCADDIAVAVPLGFTAAIAHAARRGVILKGSQTLERLWGLRYILTDKTGTLTFGRPKVIDCKGFGGFSDDEAFRTLAMGALGSQHIVSRAILSLAKEHDIKLDSPEAFKEMPGQGMEFSYEGKHFLSGRLDFLEARKVPISDEARAAIDGGKKKGYGETLLANPEKVLGVLSYSDELRPESYKIIKETRKYGVKEWHMLTGDNEQAAKLVADELHLRHYHSNLRPESKFAFVEEFKKQHPNEAVGMIGDGVNDAAALSLVDVSFAMGGIGSDAAIEAADIALMKDDLSRVPEIIALAQKARHVTRENFAIWAFTNISGLALVGLGALQPTGAATYNFLTDFIPIANALRLLF